MGKNATVKIKKGVLVTEKGLVSESEAMKAYVAGFMKNARRKRSFYHGRGISSFTFVRGKKKMKRKI